MPPRARWFRLLGCGALGCAVAMCTQRACEWCSDGVGWQAPCSCIELLAPHPLHSSPMCRYGLAGAFGILCCLPTERNSMVCLSHSAPCPHGWWGGRKASLVFLACLAQLRGCLGP